MGKVGKFVSKFLSKLVSKLVSQLVSKLVSKLLVVSLSSEIRKGRSYRGKSRPVFPLEIIEQVHKMNQFRR